MSVYGEERGSFGNTSGLTHAYGIDITPTEAWSFGASMEVGDLEERNRLIEREAYTASAGYANDRMTGGLGLEWRTDQEVAFGVSSERETWLL